MTLTKEIEKALRRETADDHLTHEERKALVAKYRAENPARELPANTDDAFIVILFD